MTILKTGKSASVAVAVPLGEIHTHCKYYLYEAGYVTYEQQHLVTRV